MKDLAELTTHCIRCGFCLESCPTFVVTGNEMESPRGRIYLIRSAAEGKLRWEEDVREHLDLCLGCRNCETACPSAVEYGAILEMARDTIEQAHPNRPKHALLAGMTNPAILKTQLLAGRLLPGARIPGFVSRLVSGAAPEVDRPTPQHVASLPELDPAQLPAVRGEVYLLEGCAMRVLFPRVHQATRRLLRRVGYEVREVKQGCCGSLYAHNGYLEQARSLADELISAMPDDLPVIVNSAGCGSTMKEYDHLFGMNRPSGASDSVAAQADFAKRVKDPSEFLLSSGLTEQLVKAAGIHKRITYHDACHLAHGQRITKDPRELIRAIPGIDYVELPEADLCCGSAGIYNVTEPKMARTLIERKYANIAATGADIVATGNPGCHAWLAQAAKEHGRAVEVMHTMELLESAFNRLN